MKNCFIYDYISNITVNPEKAGLALSKLAKELKKLTYSSDVKTYEDAIKNIDKVDIDTIQNYNPFFKPTEEQRNSLKLLSEMI